MKLAGKLVGALVLGLAILLSVDAAIAARQEAERLEADMRGDALMLGRPLADLIGEVWTASGEERARLLLARANEASTTIDLSLEPATTIPGTQLDVDDRAHVVTTLPVEGRDGPVAALRLAESRDQLDTRRRAAVSRAVVLVALTGGMCMLLVVWLGLTWIGRPLAQLAAKVRRIGEGDLSGPLGLRGNDELTELGRGLDEMCEHLAAAREAVAREQAGRLAVLEQLRQADRLRTVGRLASEVAHELGTPLNVVAGRAELIATGELPAKAVLESAQIIKAQSQRMSASIRQLLDFSRRQPPSRARRDLADVAREAVSLLGPLADAQETRLQCAASEPARAEVASAPLQQVLSNLIVNALHVTGKGGHITLETGVARALEQPSTLGPAADWAYVGVVDDGTGISEGDMAHLFEPFFTTKEAGAGTGLGLSLARGIVTEHGGWIAAESRPGEGSRFTVYLPLVSE